MASSQSLVPSVVESPGANEGRPDTPPLPGAQARGDFGRRLRTRSLVCLRFGYLLAQCLGVLVTWKLLRWPVHFGACFSLIGLSAILNLGLAALPAMSRESRPWETTGQLAFDIVQLTAVVGLCGGVVNPLAALLIGPATLAGIALPGRRAAAICVLAVAGALFVTLTAVHPPWPSAAEGAAYNTLRLGRSTALLLAIVIADGFAYWSSATAARRELALHVVETVLAREQRLSALGALAAAVAHELGTPLATITIIASEMAREAPEGPLREDARLMVEQARRCRDILRRLAEKPEQKDSLHERMSLLQMVREIVEPYAKKSEIRVEALVTGPPGVTAPDVWRRPEILHAVTTLVENAFDFARGEVLLTARFDAASVAVEVHDDGAGFPADILARLGEPYLTTRSGGEGSRTGHVGMGLGIFIAKTLLERSGARVSFSNGPRRGAIITARWPRSRIEVTEPIA
jgi:two-component system sensor histidine kinase RegB